MRSQSLSTETELGATAGQGTLISVKAVVSDYTTPYKVLAKLLIELRQMTDNYKEFGS